MRKELREIEEADRFLLRLMPAGDRLVFRARMLLSPELNRKVRQQARVHRLVRWYGRDLRREQLVEIYTRLMADEDFNSRIHSIFK